MMTPSSPAGRARTALTAVAGLVLAVTIAACGTGGASDDAGVVSLASPSPAPGSSAAPSSSIDPEDAMLAFQRCMKDHGVDVQVSTSVAGQDKGGVSVSGSGPDPAGPGASPQVGAPPDQQKLQQADAACRDLLPSGMLGDPNATMDPQVADQALAFAKCMRDHGIDFPDPQFNGGGMTIQIGGPGSSGGPAIDPSSKLFGDAQTACAKEAPGGGPMVIGGSAPEPKP